MQGEENSERNVGSFSASTVANPQATQVTAFKPSAPPHRTTAPPAQYAPKRHHRHKDEDASSEDEDRSKLELECQFAGIDIDPDTAELDLDDDDNNVDNASPTAPPLEDYRVPQPGCSSSASGAPSLACSLQTGGGVGVEAGGSDPVALEEEADLEGAAKVECTEVIVPIQTLAQKCLFYITAFFVLLAVFSLFAFLFLVPFVIDPAFETIFMEFDPEPATCYTDSTVFLRGTSNCKWTSCREGCTREIFNCTQIRVNYRRASRSSTTSSTTTSPPARHSNPSSNSASSGRRRTKLHKGSSELTSGSSGCASDDPYWDCRGAHLYPNVKGCGYPPWINCTAFYKEYGTVGTLFSCYYSKVNPMMVMTENDMKSVVWRLVYSMAIPIPSFIISVVYLIFAYFRLYSSGSGSSVPVPPPPVRTSTSSTNNNIGASGGSGGQELNKSASRNALAGEGNKLVGNNSQGLIEMNDLNPSLHNHGLLDHEPPDGDLLLPRRNNRAPERNGPNNPNAKHKGQRLEEDEDDSHLRSEWADSSSLKRSFQGLANGVSWKPR